MGELKRQIADVQSKLNQQKNLYDAVCTDRNLYSKNLIESNEEIAEMRRRFKIMYHEIKKLESTIQEAEQEKQSQQKEYDGVISERDILGTQLIRRNEELALLYEKIKIQQSTLQKGELQYKERVDEVAAYKENIARLRRELHAARTQVVNIEGLKREVRHLNKELLHERAKCKALQDELETPMNVHRWRKLEGSDPAG